ncbi:MAG TPA: type IV pilin protein [Rhodanobacteraceae bacterium]
MSMSPGPSRRWRAAGFTLIELMIVCAIIAILAALAYPSYSRYVTRTHRTAAEACLSEVANYMERYYTTNLSYKAAALPQLDCVHQTSGSYSYKIAQATSAAYMVTATPINGQLTSDTGCGVLSLDQTGSRDINGTEASGGQSGIAACW